MIVPESIVDVQSRPDNRNIKIDRVGIKAIRHPILVSLSNKKEQPSIATSSLAVSLQAEVKGTHMSRFVHLIEQTPQRYNIQAFQQLLRTMIDELNAQHGFIRSDFIFFMAKRAPVSQVSSNMDYAVQFIGEVGPYHMQTDVQVVIPVTSLCPCSKEISAYGAHNQRSHLTVRLRLAAPMALEEIVTRAEQHASCELYGLLKRADEKYVTEKAYNNPKFVEDLVRDVAREFESDPRVIGYAIESENFESIHNHSAYAMIDKLS